MIIKKDDKNTAQQVAESLKNGSVAILPTDTVYGFSGIVDLKNASSHYETDKKIRNIKGRDENKPLIQLIAKPEDIFLYTDIKIQENLLLKWPGPLTIIVPIKDNSPYAQPENYKTVAFRCPGDAWLRDVINIAGAPIFSTSVNRSGFPVLDEIEEIKNEFENETDIIVDDGDKKGGIPSTLVSILDGNIKVLRQGSVRV